MRRVLNLCQINKDSVVIGMLAVMVDSIKLFQSVQNSYRAMGIYSPHPNQRFTLNPRKLFFLSGLIGLFISRLGYFIFEAKFVEDNGFESFYQTFLILIGLAVFLMSVYQMPELIQAIKMFDEFIEKSESTIRFASLSYKNMIILLILNNEIGNKWPLYHGLDVKIEKLSQLMHFAFVRLTCFGTVTFFLLVASINYFIFDLGSDSFEDFLLLCVKYRKNCRLVSNISLESFILGCLSIGELGMDIFSFCLCKQ